MVIRLTDLLSKITDNLNFFRIHVLFFTFTPLIFSAIFYAANGATHVPYIDALFACFSAGTVCGLATIDLSSLTGFQQAILFIQSLIGNQVVPSWVMVYIRRRYFNKRLQYIVEAEVQKRKALAEQRALEEKQKQQEEQEKQEKEKEKNEGGEVDDGEEEGGKKLLRRFTRMFTGQSESTHHRLSAISTGKGEDDEKDGIANDLRAASNRTDTIRRTSTASQRVDPNGQTTHSVPNSENVDINTVSAYPSQTSTLRNDSSQTYADAGTEGVPLENTQTVTFKDPDPDPWRKSREDFRQAGPEAGYFDLGVESPGATTGFRPSVGFIHDDRTYIPPGGAPLRRRTTVWTSRTQSHRPASREGSDMHSSIHDEESAPSSPVTKNKGYGGFPYPTTVLYHLLKKAFHYIRRGLERSTLLPERTRSMLSTISHHSTATQGKKAVKYFSNSFNALVGRNSKFYDLTEENLEELGGAEYRALNALLWIIAIYHFSTQLLSFTIIAPYMNIQRWAPVFSPPNLHQHVSPTWYSAFQVVSAYTTTGLSLVDQSMIPFQEAYPLIFVVTFLILAGNLGFPIFLRFFIWSIMKLVPGTRLNETLHFLLDHPRRCYFYLFPARQTWLLLSVVLLLDVVILFLFLVLNIGVAYFEAIPLGVRFAIGLLQVTATRAGGFVIVAISSLAPAIQVLFVILMYLGVYPIALSVQATNVYEEKSLGVFDEDEDEEEEHGNKEPEFERSKPSSYGRYLVWHARQQLAFDMWWLGLVLFLLCTIERSKIQNSDNYQWFTVFALIFEIISAYAGVGMSLGVPYANYSFSGALTPLSKLILIAVMLRGRHRGLPVAIDRAVMLPFEFKKAEAAAAASNYSNASAVSLVRDGEERGEGAEGERTERRRGGARRAVEEVEAEEMSVMNRFIDENGEVRVGRRKPKIMLRL